MRGRLPLAPPLRRRWVIGDDRARAMFLAAGYVIWASNSGMPEGTDAKADATRFEQVVLPHLNAAFNLARWLVRNPHDAEDIVQEAYLRAFKFWGGYEGGDARAWLLKIVRNASYSFLEKNRPAELAEEFDEKLHIADADAPTIETALVQSAESKMLRAALEALPVNFREAVILRELQGLSYKEIAAVMEVPIGTVMSSLARGRAMLRESLLRARERETESGLRR
jgi:RNA polymerase sigma factor (sigma-70 family)